MTSDPGNPGFLKRHRPGKPFVGITVMPEYLQSETVDGVLDNLVEKAGATAVATSPYLMEPASGQDGSREPPDDAGAGKVRLLERPLWGKRDLWVRTAPSFEPRPLHGRLRPRPLHGNRATCCRSSLRNPEREVCGSTYRCRRPFHPVIGFSSADPRETTVLSCRMALSPPGASQITGVLPVLIFRAISGP